MAVPWRRREGRPCLDAQPWRPLRAVAEQSASGGELMVKSLFTEDGYHVMLTDLGRVWEESLEGDAIVARTKVLHIVSLHGAVSVEISFNGDSRWLY